MSDKETAPWIQKVAAEILVGKGICPVCRWRLAESAEKGCVLGNCSYRTEEGWERDRLRQKRERWIEVCQLIAVECRTPAPQPAIECGAEYHDPNDLPDSVELCELPKGHDGDHESATHWWRAPQSADLLQTIHYLLLSWSVFYAKLPAGEYDGLAEMRTAVANLNNSELLAVATPQVTPSPLTPEEVADARSQTLAFQWLTDNGYPTAGMSQKEGFTAFQLAPILEAYWIWRKPASEQAPQELELEQEADGRWLAAYTRFPGVAAYGPTREESIWNAAKVLIESEQASPTPDKCPRCGSKDYWTALPACHGGMPDPWHSSAGTPKGTK